MSYYSTQCVNSMKLKEYKPSFYDNFSCIADKCDFTCCQEWAIGVDDDTLDKWEELDIPNCCNLPEGKLSEYVVDEAIAIDENLKCPYLNEKGLCNIVLTYGEETLSHTCHTFPRVTYNYEGRREYTLNLGCKHAVELLFAEEEFMLCKSLNEAGRDEDEEISDLPEVAFAIRDFFLECAGDKETDVWKILKAIFYMSFELLEIWDMDSLEETEIEDYLASEVFNNVKNVLNDIPDDEYIMVDSFREGNEILLDVLTSYYEQEMYMDYIDEIYDAANLLVETPRREIYEKLIKFKEEVEPELMGRFRLILQNEIYGFILPSEGDELELMIQKIEWLTMEMVALRQWLFILWDKYGKIESDVFNQVVAVLFRITGFNDDDIFEYIESEFEDSIWDFGYINLIL